MILYWFNFKRLCLMCNLYSNTKIYVLQECLIALVASFFMGFGILFLLLWVGIYIWFYRIFEWKVSQKIIFSSFPSMQSESYIYSNFDSLYDVSINKIIICFIFEHTSQKITIIMKNEITLQGSHFDILLYQLNLKT